MTEIEPLHLSGYEEFPLTAFLNISFTHHSVILRREPVSRNHPLQESE